MIEALVLLFLVSAEQYAEQNHGVWYETQKSRIERYHIDDAANVVEAYQKKYIEFKWKW